MATQDPDSSNSPADTTPEQQVAFYQQGNLQEAERIKKVGPQDGSSGTETPANTLMEVTQEMKDAAQGLQNAGITGPDEGKGERNPSVQVDIPLNKSVNAGKGKGNGPSP